MSTCGSKLIENQLLIIVNFFRRPGDVATSYADVTLAAKELGWKAKRGLKEMCEDTWNWQRLNPNGFSGAN